MEIGLRLARLVVAWRLPQMNTSSRDHLKDILKRFSVRRGLPGQFKLASGRTSEWYVDGKLTTCRAEAMPLIGRAFIDKIEEHGWPVDAVGGLIIGADPIVMAIARESLDTNKVIDAFLVRKEPKKHGLQKFIEGLAEPMGLNVVIIDDVCTTGESTRMAIDFARQAGLNVQGALCLVDREEGAAELMRELGCPFDWIFALKEFKEAHGPAELAEACSGRSHG
jgi:orotate phosphoribosyltransferase